jgi:hypothetical protein
MAERPDDSSARRASDDRFRRRRAALTEALGALLGPRAAPEPLADADRAAALASEARAGYQEAEGRGWALVRRVWPRDDRAAVAEVMDAMRAALGERAVWLIVPGREPQAVPTTSDAVLDNPLGFAALAEGEFTLLDERLPAGLTLVRHPHASGSATAYSWELEAWGAEPWLSAATRALRERGGAG